MQVDHAGRFSAFSCDGFPHRLGIMGGTFDPIHNGHLVCAEQARERFHLDGVLFVPAAVSHFKQNSVEASAEERLEMCRLAVSDNPYFEVSTIEIEREGISYSADTLTQLRSYFPEKVEFFFILGADSFLSLTSWYKSASLAASVAFIVDERPGYALADSFKDEMSSFCKKGVGYFQSTSLAISSHEMREKVKCGRSLRYLCPSAVCDYISANGLYVNAR